VYRNPELHCVSISIPANLNDAQNPTRTRVPLPC
jgi:hypothetical protein